MAAKNKSDLLAISEKEFAKLLKLVEPIESHAAMRKDEDDTSIKDVIAHRAHWIDLFLGWYADGQAGTDVHFPAKGYKWNQLKEYNAQLRESHSDLPWDEAVSILTDRHAKLIGFIDEHSDADLYGGPMKGGRNDWTAGRWAEAAGPSHYRSAAKYVRSRLKAG